MMRKSILWSATALSLSLIAISNAAVANEPVLTAWNGLYAGLHGGWGEADFDHSFYTNGHYNSAPGQTFNYNGDGGLYGAHIGSNWQQDFWVIGLEAAATGSSINKSNVVSPFFPVTDRWASEINWIATVTPRIGIVPHENLLVYAKGGLAAGSFRDYVKDNSDFVDVNNTLVGFTVGGGFEVDFGSNWALGVEYNFYDFGNRRIATNGVKFLGGPCGCSTDHNLEVIAQSVLVRLSYKFGGRQQ